MKYRILLSVFAISFLAYFSSCGGGNTGQELSPVMYSLVNSTNWRSPDPRAILSENSIKVYGTSANGQTILLSINAGIVGEYTLSQQNGNYAEYVPNLSVGSARYSTNNNENGTGFVRISSIDEEAKTVSGTYNFKAYKSTDNSFKSITDGTFTNVPYKFINTSDTTGIDNSFIFVENSHNWITTTINAFKNDTALVITAECDRSEAWQSITMWMSPTITAGVHYITQDGPVYAKFQQGFFEYPAVNGSVTIIENNQTELKIRGTFFFNYVNSESETLSITGGQFEVLYEDLTVIP